MTYNDLLYTPDLITKLSPTQIALFGSNKLGYHGKGFALTCYKKFGAIYGQAEGLQGQTYGVITKELRKYMPKVTLNEVEEGIIKFYEFAMSQPELQFLVTKIGCDLAGFALDDIAGIFGKHYESSYYPNILFPIEFVSHIKGYL